MRTRPTLSALLAIGAATLTLTAVAPSAVAAPNTGSAGGSSSSGCGPRSNADRLFLRESYFDREDCDTQDAGIRLAQAECRWLDAHGNSAANRIELAESTEDTLEYPFTFLDAAIQAYCPQYRD
ncbi:DUF732 domain-containing protein [Nocardia sp. NPDC060259]|uniref:DUF732 domain-containing protein n=1 Tax=Nocardia sp. NPDC060259 TaxID=3347088 RepID=UPI00364F64C6